MDARKVTMAEIDALMKEPVTRVVIFDKAGCPIFVIRRKLYPSDWIGADGKAALDGRTVQSYLEGNGGANATDAALFGFVAPGATLEEARGGDARDPLRRRLRYPDRAEVGGGARLADRRPAEERLSGGRRASDFSRRPS